MSEDSKTTYEGVRVLIIEDQIHTRTMLKGMLRQMGIFSALEASDGRAGLMEIARTRPTLVLCDIHMQPVDGRQFLKTLRASKVDWLRSMPVIFLTADSNPETVKLAKGLQVDGYLVKPVAFGDLKGRIDAVLKNVDRSPKARGL